MKKKGLLILIIPFVLIAIAYPFLPAMIPRTFGLNLKPKAYMAKEFLFIFGVIPYLVYMKFREKKNK